MRSPKSLLAGLMWQDLENLQSLDNIRHEAQDRDGEYFYGAVAWELLR